MEEQVNTAVAEIEKAESHEAACEIYVALPKALRREIYAKLPDGERKKKVRAAIEARRGIVLRGTDGTMLFNRETMKEQILRLAEKQNLMVERKAKLGERVVELKKQAHEMYGDDFIAEVETALEQL